MLTVRRNYFLWTTVICCKIPGYWVATWFNPGQPQSNAKKQNKNKKDRLVIIYVKTKWIIIINFSLARLNGTKDNLDYKELITIRQANNGHNDTTTTYVVISRAHVDLCMKCTCTQSTVNPRAPLTDLGRKKACYECVPTVGYVSVHVWTTSCKHWSTTSSNIHAMLPEGSTNSCLFQGQLPILNLLK